MKEVTILQHRLLHYNVEFFEQLSEILIVRDCGSKIPPLHISFYIFTITSTYSAAFYPLHALQIKFDQAGLKPKLKLPHNVTFASRL